MANTLVCNERISPKDNRQARVIEALKPLVIDFQLMS
jgi:hypothetical protein